jgi:serine/threonine protein kinase/Flp pilus assembly protein TadD
MPPVVVGRRAWEGGPSDSLGEEPSLSPSLWRSLSSETLMAAAPRLENWVLESLSTPGSEAVSVSEDGAGAQAGGDALEALAGRLIREMNNAWWQGRTLQVEHFLSDHPELLDRPDVALRLVREEVRLRHNSGTDVSTLELVQRFPQWEDRLEALFDPSLSFPDPYPQPQPQPQPHLHEPSAPRLPGADEQLGEYRLLAVLGRGARGAVYLAEQPDLANRPVVLKVTPRDGSEHLSLARLQHAHIVPLYAVQDLAERDLRLLCMPYVGGTTLARLLGSIAEIAPAQRTGRHLLNELDQAQAELPVSVPLQGPARQLLGRLSYTQAVCWLGACLADALHFAHQRELLHLDLKPSNILLAADGTPMLLDFHLARAPIPAGERVRHRLGGTLAYMPAEQWAAMVSAREGRPLSCTVDHRADLYALGLLLYEMLGGSPRPALCPQLPVKYCRPENVSVGLSDILARCVAFRPEDRYPSAALLAEDLRRQLADLPLRGVPNRSLTERWRKWRRRQPQAFGRATAVAVASAGLFLGVAAVGGDARRRLRGAESLLNDARVARSEHNEAAAVRSLERGLTLLDPAGAWPLGGVWPRARTLRRTLERELQLARHAGQAGALHRLADRVRLLYGTDLAPAAELRRLEDRLRAAWQARDTALLAPSADLPPAAASRLRTDALDLVLLWADLRVRLAPPGTALARHLDALRTLAEAEVLFGPSPVLDRERQAHAEALGIFSPALAAATRPLAAAVRAPRTAWEHYAIGRARLGAGDLQGAARALDRAVELRPDDLWGHFYRGTCAYRRRAFGAAAHDFDICVALAPSSAECYYNRARAHAALGDDEQAVRDYGHALRLSPHLAAAALNRGVIHYRHGRYQAALADFLRARDDGADPEVVRHNLALAESAQAADPHRLPGSRQGGVGGRQGGVGSRQ